MPEPLPRVVTDARLLLEHAAGPAVVIALPRARIVAANAAGAARIGLDAAARDTPLDAAMPAVARLKSLMHGDRAASCAAETLSFWTPHGVLVATCSVAFHATAHGEMLAMVAFGDMDAASDPAHPSPHDVPESRDARETGPPRDDTATLREIARRIREGQRQSAAALAGRHAIVEAPTMATAGSPPDSSGRPTRDAAPAVTPREAPPPAQGTRTRRLAKLAHELKTPLSAIAAAAEIMRDERLGPIGNERYRSYASDIFDSARHALLVIANMLGDDAPAAAGGQPAELPAMVFAEIDLTSLAESCVSSMRPLAEAARLELAAGFEPRLPHVIADATAVRQIILNLVTNALKFTAAGGVVRLATRHCADGSVEVEIADTGRGMTTDEIAEAAVAGSDREPARREGGGLGIGLPLVGALARANGAAVTITSAPDSGTRVVLAFAKDRVIPV
mgnify:CR=1 FL=1